MSDHFSGPAVTGDPAVDITDFYVFASPERPGWTTLVLNAFPIAGPDALFSDAVTYRVRARAAALADGAPTFGEAEFVIDTHFGLPTDAGQPVDCTGPDGIAGAFTTGTPFDAPSLRAFAGLRSDPFFMDVGAALETEISGRLSYKEKGDNPLADRDCLSLVLEVPTARIADAVGSDGMVAFVAETVGVGGVRTLRIERVGRPEVKNFMLAGSTRDRNYANVELRDLYNREDAFALAKEYRPLYASRMDANLAFFDGLDDQEAWPLLDDARHPLRELFLGDALLLDLSQPFAPGHFLELERAHLEGRNPRGGGGRWLDDDILDEMVTLFVNGGRGPRLGDGLDAPTKPAVLTFPYLQSPNLRLDLPPVGVPGE